MTAVTPDIVLGIDQAACSGWAIHMRGGIVRHGVAKSTDDRARVLAHVAVLTDRNPEGADWTRVLVVFEDHSGIPLHNRARYSGGPVERNAATILGMGAARGWWDEQLNLAGHPQALRIAVEPKDWHKRVLGVNGAVREDLKRISLRWACAKLGETITDDNESDAIAIAAWGAVDGVSNWEGRRTHARAVAQAKRQAKRQSSLW